MALVACPPVFDNASGSVRFRRCSRTFAGASRRDCPTDPHTGGQATSATNLFSMLRRDQSCREEQGCLKKARRFTEKHLPGKGATLYNRVAAAWDCQGFGRNSESEMVGSVPRSMGGIRTTIPQNFSSWNLGGVWFGALPNRGASLLSWVSPSASFWGSPPPSQPAASPGPKWEAFKPKPQYGKATWTRCTWLG